MRTQISGLISRCRPVPSLMKVKESRPEAEARLRC